MIAITVILAAVIASFVLGLGSEASTTPTTTVEVDYKQAHKNDDGPNAGYLEVKHGGGNSIDYRELYLRGSGFNQSTDETGSSSKLDVKEWGDIDVIHHRNTTSGHQQWNGTVSGADSTVVSDDSAFASVNSDYELKVIYQSQGGDESSILKEKSGPDA